MIYTPLLYMLSDGPIIESTAQAYDLSKVQEMIKNAVIGAIVPYLIHHYKGFLMPLITPPREFM